jgi:phosphate starvation-inducible PhoH-like protein
MKKTNLNDKKYVPIYYPKTENQIKYVDQLSNENNTIIIALGPAGTGKTLFACSEAIKQLKFGLVDKIIITRPLVTVEEDLGFLPGNINKKMDPWTRPIFDIFLEVFSQREIDVMVLNNIIEISPLAYMRGRTFKNAFIIADEMQNSSPNQMMMLTTRIGVKSKMVITGDLKQTDKGNNSGLSDFVNRFELYKKYDTESKRDKKEDDKNIEVIYLGKSDIERNPIVKKIIDIYQFDVNDVNDKSKELDQGNKTKYIKSEKIYNYESSYEYGYNYDYEFAYDYNVNNKTTNDTNNNTKNDTTNNTKNDTFVIKKNINYENDAAMIPLREMTRKDI